MTLRQQDKTLHILWTTRFKELIRKILTYSKRVRYATVKRHLKLIVIFIQTYFMHMYNITYKVVKFVCL